MTKIYYQRLAQHKTDLGKLIRLFIDVRFEERIDNSIREHLLFEIEQALDLLEPIHNDADDRIPETFEDNYFRYGA